jgi:hypothetical protein
MSLCSLSRGFTSQFKTKHAGKKQKAGHASGFLPRQPGRLGLLRPVAFRPLLTKGLALSGNGIQFFELDPSILSLVSLVCVQYIIEIGVDASPSCPSSRDPRSPLARPMASDFCFHFGSQ